MMPDVDETSEKFDEHSKRLGIAKLKKQMNDLDIFEGICITESYLLRFLYSANFDENEAFLRIKEYHNQIVTCPEFYPVTGPLDRKSLVERKIGILLPDCDRAGRPIYIFKPGNIDCSATTFAKIAELDDNWFEYILCRNPEIAGKGLCYILDVKNHSYGFIKWLNIDNIKKGINKIANLPFKDFVLHVVNKSIIIKFSKTIAWPLLPESSKKNVKFHFSNWQSLHQYIDPKYLPKEYGGYKEIQYERIYKSFFDGHDEITRNYQLTRRIPKIK